VRNHGDYSVVVFPFLRTQEAVPIGELSFRSTEDTASLTAEQSESVNDIASMLFLRDNLRLRSASYAIVPYIDLDAQRPEIGYLADIQAVVAYCYASPRHSFGDLFLSSEHASLAIFSPGDVPVSLVQPDFNVETVGEALALAPNEFGEVSGYSGLYNFRHHFWVSTGSRVYGPKPHMTLNYSQDLRLDLTREFSRRVDYQLLNDLLRRSGTATSERIFTAVRWFNAANDEASDEAASIVDLAIAFEALLRLPRGEKTDRLTDAIALLLGRIPRLEVWARQFYDARSQIVHEGQTHLLRFVASDSGRPTQGPLYQSLLSYGRQIFQLCLGALLVGAELADEAGLEQQLVTNEERFRKICILMADEQTAACERLVQAEAIVDTIERYRFVPESNLSLETIVGATQLAARTLLACDPRIEQELRDKLETLSTAARTDDEFERLDAVREVNDQLSDAPPKDSEHVEVVRRLVETAWGYVFMHHFWLRQSRSSSRASSEDKDA
jgi:Apea-like HEPN